MRNPMPTHPLLIGQTGSVVRRSACWLLVATFFYAATVLAAEPEPAEARADALLARMTLQEKISQLVLFTGYGAVTGPVEQQQTLEEHIRKGECGNVFNVMSVAQVQKLQKIAVEQTRL